MLTRAAEGSMSTTVLFSTGLGLSWVQSMKRAWAVVGASGEVREVNSNEPTGLPPYLDTSPTT